MSIISHNEKYVTEVTKWRCGLYNPRSMVDHNHLIWLLDYIDHNKIDTFVEIGVAMGGVLALVAKISPNTKVIGLDSWEGMPEISKEDDQSHKRFEGVAWSKMNDVYDTFKKIEAPLTNLRLIKGFCEETIPQNIGMLTNIDILRLDIDWYKGTKFCLEALYGNVKAGGLIIIDDYFWNLGCRQAVDEFLCALDPKPDIHELVGHEGQDFGPIHFFKYET